MSAAAAFTPYEHFLLAVLLEESPRQRDPVLKGWLKGAVQRLRGERSLGLVPQVVVLGDDVLVRLSRGQARGLADFVWEHRHVPLPRGQGVQLVAHPQLLDLAGQLDRAITAEPPAPAGRTPIKENAREEGSKS